MLLQWRCRDIIVRINHKTFTIFTKTAMQSHNRAGTFENVCMDVYFEYTDMFQWFTHLWASRALFLSSFDLMWIGVKQWWFVYTINTNKWFWMNCSTYWRHKTIQHLNWVLGAFVAIVYNTFELVIGHNHCHSLL